MKINNLDNIQVCESVLRALDAYEKCSNNEVDKMNCQLVYKEIMVNYCQLKELENG
jgi:hypothetical protein